MTAAAPHRTPRRIVRARMRFAAMIVVGLVVGTVVSVTDSWLRGPAAGWACTAFLYDVWVWTEIAGMDARRTATHARVLDPGRRFRETLVLVANLVSLAAVGLLIADTSSLHGWHRYLCGGLALFTVFSSWLLVQTLFTQRYADQYYQADPVGGIGFNQSDPPCYLDFAYMAFSIGMTYQVSDNAIGTSAIRRTALVHSLLAFVFGIGIVATTISLVVDLAQAGP